VALLWCYCNFPLIFVFLNYHEAAALSSSDTDATNTISTTTTKEAWSVAVVVAVIVKKFILLLLVATRRLHKMMPFCMTLSTMMRVLVVMYYSSINWGTRTATSFIVIEAFLTTSANHASLSRTTRMRSRIGYFNPAVVGIVPSHYSSSLTTTTTTNRFYQESTTALSMAGGPSKTNNNKPSTSPTVGVIQGIGEEGCMLPSPSRVNTMPAIQQATIVIAIFIGLGIGTVLFNTVLTSISSLKYEWFQSFHYSWPITLGLVFTLAGITHFTVAKEYENIYPAPASWGIWYLPGSKEFHVAWTGVAEILGGIGLFLGGIIDFSNKNSSGSGSTLTLFTDAGITSDCAILLFLLTWAVTPANIYMYTHGAKLPMNVEGDVPITFHIVRFIMQIVLLGLLLQIGSSS
jgi:uncharacterized membrane protein